MENLFDERISEGTIFANKEVLRPTYVPDKLPHREEQIRDLADVLLVTLKKKAPPHLLICGNTGTGKTSTVKYVCNLLGETVLKRRINCSLLYINSGIFDSQYRIFAYLARVFNKRVPMIGWPTDKVYSELKNGIDAEKRCIIIVLDEVDNLASKGDDTLDNLLMMNDELTKAKVSLIAISNDLPFTDLLDQGIKSSLDTKEILFSPYKADQLNDILRERAKEAFNGSTLDERVLPLCAAAASGLGDAGHALDLLRMSGEIAERAGSKKVNEEHVSIAIGKLEMSKVAEVIKTLPLHSKIVLSSMLFLSRERHKKNFSSGEVYNMYQGLCTRLGIAALTPRRVTDFVTELDFLGLVKAVIVSKGRYGRTKVIALNVSEECVRSVLGGEHRMKGILDIGLRTQVVSQGV